MSETPFWKSDSAGDADLQPLAGAPASHDHQPNERKPGEVFIVGGHEFRWVEGPQAEVQLTDGDGNDLANVYLPYAPDNQPSEEDVLAEADRLYHDMEYMRSIVEADAIEQLVADVHSSGTAKGMIDLVAEGLAGSLSLTFSDDDDTPPEQREAIATEAARLFDEKLPSLISDMLEAQREHGRNFWHNFARDIIAMATLHARDEIAESLGGPEAVEKMGDDEFDAHIFEAYRTGPYVTGAMLSLTREWTVTLYETISTTMLELSQREDGNDIGEALIKAARKSLGLPEMTPAMTPPTLTPAFDPAGYGRTHNDVVSIGARRALSATPSRWNIGVEAWPVFTHENGSGKALYSPSRTFFPTARDAMRAVESYSPAHVAMLKYITAKHVANSAAHTTGPYGGFYMSVEEFLEFRGIKKQSAGGYRTEDRREVIALVEALEHIEVTGSIEGYEKRPGKRGKKSSLTIRSPLIVVSHRVTQRGMPGGEERPVAWYLRPGDWAAELERFAPQFAVTTKALLQLNTQNDMHAFNLGNHLTEQYRIRANQQSWTQPYRVCKLLEGAEIEVDRKHAGRFRQRIEAALDVLANPVDMRETPIIERWKYADVVEAKGRGWFDHWLSSGVIITPPAGLVTPYESIGRRRSKPKVVAG